MIDATSSAKGNINIYWITFEQIADNRFGAGYMLALDRTEPGNYTVLVHDCTFNANSVGSYVATVSANGIIFWNDTFLPGGGIQFYCDKYGPTSSWNTPDSYGMEDSTGLMNSYVENCKFGPIEYLLDIDDNARVVFRDNTVQDGEIGSHGQESSPYGCREFEIYNNTFKATSGDPYNNQCWFMDRGGAGLIWGNAMDDISAGGGYGGGKSSILFCVFST